MRILAIDPGNIESAYIMMFDGKIMNAEKVRNEIVLSTIKGLYSDDLTIVIEKIQSFGMVVGATVFETCYWIGRFWQEAVRHDIKVEFVTRMEEKMCLCHNSRAKDKNIHQALVDRYGPVPTKKRPNPFYDDIKLSGDMWSALAVAVTYMERMEKEKETLHGTI